MRRISQKIEEYEEKEGPDAFGLGVFTMTDMIRATLTVKLAEHLQQCYSDLEKMSELNIVKIKNELCTDLQNITINFIYSDMIVGEIQLRYRSKPVNYYGNHFLYQLIRSDSVFAFRQKILLLINRLAEHQ